MRTAMTDQTVLGPDSQAMSAILIKIAGSPLAPDDASNRLINGED